MNFDENSRRLLFRYACVPVRLIIASLITFLKHDAFLKILIQVYLFTTAFVFTVQLYRTIIGTKKKGGFGGEIWWRELRYIHIALYITAGVLVSMEVQYGGAVLYADVFIGFVVSFWLQ